MLVINTSDLKHLHLESLRDEINKITGIPAGVIDFKVALQNKRNREQL